jgi:hypothetical protein
MIIDPADFEVQDLYKLLIGSVVPRPIAWTSTISPDDIEEGESDDERPQSDRETVHLCAWLEQCTLVNPAVCQDLALLGSP